MWQVGEWQNTSAVGYAFACAGAGVFGADLAGFMNSIAG